VDGKIGTPDKSDAIKIPLDMKDIVPTMLAKKTVIVIAVGLLTLNLFCISETIRSNCEDIPMEIPTRTGRTILLKTQNPA
jgi:hypothetical protein